MEHSEAYNNFIKIMENKNFERRFGIPPRVLDEVEPFERDDVEKIIWDRFVNLGDIEMTYYLPRLKNYQATEEVQKKLVEFSIPSRQNTSLAYCLYQLSNNPDFLKIVKTNILKKLEKTSYIYVIFQDCDKNDVNIYNLLKELYLELTDSAELTAVEKGLFFFKGIISNLYAYDNVQKNLELFNRYFSMDLEERKKLLIEFEKEFG